MNELDLFLDERVRKIRPAKAVFRPCLTRG